MKKYLVFVLFVFFTIASHADEGMWLPFLLEKLNIADMHKKGFKLDAEDIYSINQACLKDAVVGLTRGGFSHFCSGGIISDKGLFITNHHCGMGYVQALSTVEKDYLTNGYWAMRPEDELPCDGLSVVFLVRMEDVTLKVMEGINPDMPKIAKDSIINAHILQIEQEATGNNRFLADVKPFFSGNEFYLSVYELYNDIRLVGVPPQTIGKFGGDTDNWMWPRHTGDFCIFRIYAGKDNLPASYAAENIPYKPKKAFEISLEGVQPNDFVMVMGYPGTTNQYLPSEAIRMIQYHENPVKIKLRQIRLEIMAAEMTQSDKVRIQYASKHAGIANGWKKSIGENKGLERLNTIEVKKEIENQFLSWANADETRKAEYGNLLYAFDSVYKNLTPVNTAVIYVFEALYGIELVRFASNFIQLENAPPDKIETLQKNLLRISGNFFKNYNKETDLKIARLLLNEYFKDIQSNYIPAVLIDAQHKYKTNLEKYVGHLFQNSLFTDSALVNNLIRNFNKKHLKNLVKDPVYQLAFGVDDFYHSMLEKPYRTYYSSIDELQGKFVDGLRKMQATRIFYPDANSTFRIAYGNVKLYYPRDAVEYEYFTTLSGIIEKEDSDIPDYQVPEKLKLLYRNSDYGRFFEGKNIPVAFISTSHTTGGNSGSPVLDADGRLIGINFDRVWEGTMSDIMFDPSVCRNITLDIRFVLFIIDKYAGASYLVQEMKLFEK